MLESYWEKKGEIKFYARNVTALPTASGRAPGRTSKATSQSSEGWVG